jgi:hypothetical protein
LELAFKDCKGLMELAFKDRLVLKEPPELDCKVRRGLLVLAYKVLKVRLVQPELILQW